MGSFGLEIAISKLKVQNSGAIGKVKGVDLVYVFRVGAPGGLRLSINEQLICVDVIESQRVGHEGLDSDDIVNCQGPAVNTLWGEENRLMRLDTLEARLSNVVGKCFRVQQNVYTVFRLRKSWSSCWNSAVQVEVPCLLLESLELSLGASSVFSRFFGRGADEPDRLSSPLADVCPSDMLSPVNSLRCEARLKVCICT
jgi:hypothetical protein